MNGALNKVGVFMIKIDFLALAFEMLHKYLCAFMVSLIYYLFNPLRFL